MGRPGQDTDFLLEHVPQFGQVGAGVGFEMSEMVRLPAFKRCVTSAGARDASWA